MHNTQREREILNILKEKREFVTVKSLCETLFASESSIRRDLKKLEKGGFLKRSYGGATLAEHYKIPAFGNRTVQNATAKRDIAKKAAALVGDGAVIFLDQSSTAFYLAGELLTRKSITVVTNNIEILMLFSSSEVKVISSGGILSEDNRNCLIGGEAQRTFENIFADINFFSVNALSFDGVLTDCDRKEAEVRNSMLKNAKKNVLLCDSSKYGKTAHFKQCDLSDVDCLISEGNHAAVFENPRRKTRLL